MNEPTQDIILENISTTDISYQDIQIAVPLYIQSPLAEPDIILARYQTSNELNYTKTINKCTYLKYLSIADMFFNIMYTFYHVTFLCYLIFGLFAHYGATYFKYQYIILFFFYSSTAAIFKLLTIMHTDNTFFIYIHIFSSIINLLSVKLSYNIILHLRKYNSSDIQHLHFITRTITTNHI